MLILSAADVHRALPLSQAVEAMKQAFASLTDGTAVVVPRTHFSISRHSGASLIMPSLIDAAEPAAASLAVKVVSVFDRNAERGLPRIQAAVIVLDPETGRPLALLEGSTLTAIRTAAASGAATDLLARRESRVAAIFGAGVQARAHVEAMRSVRPIEEFRIYSRTRSKAEELIRELRGTGDPSSGCRLIVASSPREALHGADIVCAATTSATPVFDDADLERGTHINAIGSYQPHVREIPAETVVRSLVVVDSRDAAWEEAGDLIQPLNAGLISRDHVHAELGELVLGRKSGRGGDRQITFFKSVGIAVQDAAAARVAVVNARREGLGTSVEW